MIAELQFKGHQVRQLDDPYGNMQAIAWDLRSGRISAASDPRAIGASAVVPLSAGRTRPDGVARSASDPVSTFVR